MTERLKTSWFEAISEDINIGGVDFKRVVIDDKLRDAIEKYGINANDAYGMRILYDLMNMSFSQIDIVMTYNPDFVIDGRIFDIGHLSGKHIYILQKLLENDVEYRYNTTMFVPGPGSYKNIFEYIKTNNYVTSKLDKPEYASDLGVREYILLYNHMKKSTTLFDLMKPLLEENDKRRRFQ